MLPLPRMVVPAARVVVLAPSIFKLPPARTKFPPPPTAWANERPSKVSTLPLATLMVPLLTVPPPAALSNRLPLLLMLMVPAFDNALTACALVTATTPAAPMLAESAAPGAPTGFPFPVAQAVQLTMAAQLPLLVFQAQLAALAGVATSGPSSAATASAKTLRGNGEALRRGRWRVDCTALWWVDDSDVDMGSSPDDGRQVQATACPELASKLLPSPLGDR